MLLLQCRNIKKDFGIHEVLKSINLDLEAGERVGLVGKNGAGKTTLANIIYGAVQPDQGEVIWHSRNIRIGYLRQSVYYTSELLHDLYQEHDSSDISEFLHIAGELGADKVHKWDTDRFSGLSGGEKTKLALAHIWSSKPDLLILDEPTNHLDLQGVQRLIDELESYSGTILVISHDRFFLDNAVDCIWEIDNGVLQEYRGNYTFYRTEKKKRYESQLHAYEAQEKYREKLEAEIRQLKDWSARAHRESTKKGAKSGNKMGTKEYFRVKAKKMDKRVKSTVKRLERLKHEGVRRPEEEPKVSFEFYQSEARGKRVLEASNIKKSYGNRLLFDESSFYIQRGDRMGVFGANGCGKTTLVRIILGRESAEGSLFVSPSINIGYMSQDVSDLENDKKALELFDMPDRKEQGKIRTMLANLGISEILLNKPLKSLSMGERTKLKLAALLVREYDMLILDEPTNHLDLYAREQLEDALEAYEGTMLLITHDRYMLERLCDKLLVFEDNVIKRYEYGLGEYLAGKDHKARVQPAKGGLTPEEERMLLENRISDVLSRLSQAEPDTPEYIALDMKFRELIAMRNKV
ncbi:MAG TPA: ABC-F type ribosomal protection protein [Clostridiales bacterium]|nr:ABC-F type ribosomal protection protein [Clostridiales bacterium]